MTRRGTQSEDVVLEWILIWLGLKQPLIVDERLLS